MPSVEVQERPVFAVERSRTHRQKFFQTIYCNPPEGEGQKQESLLIIRSSIYIQRQGNRLHKLEITDK